MNSDFPSSKKRDTLRLFSMSLEKEGVLKIVLPGRVQMTYLGKRRVCLGPEGEAIQIKYNVNFNTFLKILLFHRYFSAIF